MLLLALLVPMAVLVRSFALEDRLSRAALEVQATETVVSGAGDDLGAVSTYLERINTSRETQTTVLYPDGRDVGPVPGEDPGIVDARLTGQARVDQTDDGARILVPVSLGGSSALPADTPVIRVDVREPGLGSGVLEALVVLGVLALLLLAGSVLLADRLGRSFTTPLRGLASYAARLGTDRHPPPAPREGPPEVREVAAALDLLVERVEVLLTRERAGVADLAHRLRTPVTALRLRVETLADPGERARLAEDLDHLDRTVDQLVREARRSEREGLVARADGVAVLAARARFWEPLAEDQGRPWALRLPTPLREVSVRADAADLEAVLDVLLDNVFTHTPEGAPVEVTIAGEGDAPVRGAVGAGVGDGRGGEVGAGVGVVVGVDGGVERGGRDGSGRGLRLVVDDGGAGLAGVADGPAVLERGASPGGSTGLGLAIARRTAEESGGTLRLGPSPLGGLRVEVVFGPA
ncbi:HAMP domain-containing sensor histidine kinase [Nocardioides perillae]